MRDNEIVAAIVAGDPAGLAEAYDKYAAGLFGYCRSLLRESADAADAVQDTFVIAASKLGELRDPDRLRPWLYAVARNECHRRLRARDAASPLDEATDVIDASADVSNVAERSQLRELVRAAITGLNPGDQEVIELSLRHELEGADLADVLGVARNHAHALLSRARGQLEKSLGALLVARSGRQSCPALDDLLRGWDGTMTVLMRKRVSRHIERCEVCGERKRRELHPMMLLGVAPLAALPAELRDQVLRLCAGGTPEALAQRAAIVGRAGSFGHSGFPVPLDPPKLARWPGHGHAAAAAGATVAAVAIAAIVVFAIGTPHHGRQQTIGSAPGRTSQPAPLPSPSAPGGSRPAAPTAAAHPPGTNGPFTGPAAAPGVPAAAGHTRVTGHGSRAGSGPGPTPPGITPSPSTVPTTPAPSTSPGVTPPPPPVSQGTVSVSAHLLVLVSIMGGPPTGTFTLTAQGGPVSHYAITIPSSLLGKLTVTPSSGSLAPGQSTRVTVTVVGLLSVDTRISVSPGGQSITVLLGVGLDVKQGR
ncbi:MAG TPA: sigma-70 family RNA polymerase sigma factor [Streptosporangiaceae bacterium]|nr:sigma-70 family RNA polymerase sigma factor [Streptosporangiaceae bacterium]